MKKNMLVLSLSLLAVSMLLTSGVKAATNTGAKPMMFKAEVPADLTASQSAELKAGASNHKASKLTFHVNSGMFWYTPNEIRVKKGDTVTIVLANANGTHDLNLPDYGKKTKLIKAGETDSFTFVANKKGTFEFYCSMGNGYHRMKGQIGVLLVE